MYLGLKINLWRITTQNLNNGNNIVNTLRVKTHHSACAYKIQPRSMESGLTAPLIPSNC